MFALALDGFGNPFFRAAGKVHFGGIEVGEAEVDANLQGADGVFPTVLGTVPGALPYDGYFALGAAEETVFHAVI